MQIVEVENKLQKKSFLSVVHLIYANDHNYVRPLDLMINDVFDREKNKMFNEGDAIRFLLVDDRNKIIGRIAAFYNAKKANTFDQPTGGVGFFECINHQEAAFMLFDAAKKWLSAKGMKAMDGPINFGENDNFWGLLVDGFTQPGFGMQYNPPYYQSLFESYGFQVYYEQITNHLDIQKPFPERFWRIAERVMQKPGLTFKHFSWSDYSQFASDFVQVYNDAWQFHDSYVPMDASHLEALMRKAKPFLMDELIWFAYQDGEPIAFIVMFLDANQIIKKLNGKLNLFNKLRFLYYRYRKTMTRIRVTVLGVKPKYQRMGIESCLFYQYRDVVAKYPHITEMELSWVGDFNPKMRKLEEAMGSVMGKKHITYRYLFDENVQLNQRASVIPMNTKDFSRSNEK